MDYHKYLTYCGLYCRLCVNLVYIPQQASKLKDTMSKAGYDFFGEQFITNFKEFWDVLGKFSENEKVCTACHGDCGNPDCKIRICAREKSIKNCPFCDEYPCEHIHEVAKRYPNLIGDGMRQKKIGIDAWIKEQEERRKAGFCYDMIRTENS